MFDNPTFTELTRSGRPTGEVVAADRFLLHLRGLAEAPVGSLVLFEGGSRGLVREVTPDTVTAINLNSEEATIGELAVLEHDSLSVGVGEGLVGRVISPLGAPLDGKGPVAISSQWPAFLSAPPITDRKLLEDRLPTGVTVVDTMFPFVLGQRIAVLGEGKVGKTTFLGQLTREQAGSGRVVVYLLIGKRKVEAESLIRSLEESGALAHTIVVVAGVESSLGELYVAPYAACAMAEFLWREGKDVVVIYDDLSNHAKVYRELSLLERTNPGRDSYPGDMFHAHSQLMERAGRLKENGRTLTAIPVVHVPGGDITGYLPTNIMSMVDGQIIFDLATFHRGVRPAVNVGLSVSRVGDRVQSPTRRELAGLIFKKLADYRRAEEFSRFGAGLSASSRADLELGEMIEEAFHQSPSELWPTMGQELLLTAILLTKGERRLGIESLKTEIRSLSETLKNEMELPSLAHELLRKHTVAAGQPAPARGERP